MTQDQKKQLKEATAQNYDGIILIQKLRDLPSTTYNTSKIKDGIEYQVYSMDMGEVEYMLSINNIEGHVGDGITNEQSFESALSEAISFKNNEDALIYKIIK